MTQLLYPTKTALSFLCLLICLFGGYSHAQCLNVVGPTVSLYWDANSEPNIDHYNVYRAPGSGSGYVVVGTTPQSPDPVSFTDTPPVSTGYYVVTAVNTSGLESGFSNELCVTLTGGSTNNAPTALADSATTNEDIVITIDVLSNDDDADGDTLTVASVTQPANGSVVINADETVSYTPASNYNGSDSFDYSVADGQGGTDTATVTVEVSAVNDAPTATDDSATSDEDITVTINVLGNDTDADGDDLTVEVLTQPTNGSVVINTDETVSYTPASNFNGSDSFDYTVADGQGGTDTATATVSVTPIEDAPIAADDSATTDEDITVTINVLSNDTDADGDALTVDVLTQPTNGSVVINADDTVSYTPASNFNGSDSFDYTVSDGQGGTDTATVTVSVTPIEDAPIAVDDSAITSPNVAVIIDVLLNDEDPDGDGLTVSSLTQPANGSVAMNLDETLSYMPALNFNGSDSFSYTVADGQGGTDSANVTVTVSGDTILVAHFTNGNHKYFESRVYLWNPSTSAGNVTVRVFTLPHTGDSFLLGEVDLGILEGSSARNIKLDEDILTPLGITLAYTEDAGNLTLEFTIEAPNVQGDVQVFSSKRAFGTYPLQEILPASNVNPTVLVANFMNGNTEYFESRVYLWNPSTIAGEVKVRVFTLPHTGDSFLLGEVNLGILGASSARNIKLDEDILVPLGIPLPYTEDAGNLTLELTIDAPNVRGAGQVFSSSRAFGTYPLQEILPTSNVDPTVLVANFMNGNNKHFESRVYLWNPSTSAGNVTARVFTLPHAGDSFLLGEVDLGILEGSSARNIKLDEDILMPLGIPLPYTEDAGNLTLEFTIEAPNVQGAGQVFSSSRAFGTFPLQEILPTSNGNPTTLVATFTNGNDKFFESRVYLWNPSTSAGNVTARVFTLPHIGDSFLLGEVDLGILGASSARNIKLAEDILMPLGIPLPYIEEAGNLTLEFTIDAPDVRGAGQVFSSWRAFGTYLLH